MKTYSQFISDILVREEWRPANAGRIAGQAFRLDKQGDPHYKVLDAALHHLTASRTRPPTNRNIITRNMQALRLQKNIDKGNREITRGDATSDETIPKVKKVVGDMIKKKTISTISRMQSKRTPEQQQSQAAVNRFDQTFHREEFKDLTSKEKP